MHPSNTDKTAVWVITPNGVKLARLISDKLTDCDVFISQTIEEKPTDWLWFESLSKALSDAFGRYRGHIFIMSTGIVVRMIAPLINSKLVDPAVVVVDDQANHAISLLSGHLGGANALTRSIAKLIGADPVITTATDVNGLPAIDMLAQEKHLRIANPRAIKAVNMALLKGRQIFVHDPYRFLETCLPGVSPCTYSGEPNQIGSGQYVPGIYVDDRVIDLHPEVLILRPASLVAGIGCNRDTPMDEIKALLEEVLANHQLALASLASLASIDVKADESGLLNLAENLKLPLEFYDCKQLKQIKEIKNPSAVVEKHVGVKSVCEAAAILTARGGALIVPKQSTKNVTVAIARINFMSSESGQAVRNT
ncbi:MAG: cobalt-precorrin 5A hydrolase [Desulfobacterales bacterium]|jgi:cobalt-precorrin 5A hydrolase